MFQQTESVFVTEKLLVSPDPGLYSMINQGVLTVDGIDDSLEMKLTDEAFDVLGFTAEEKLSLYKGTLFFSNLKVLNFLF